jgi:alpha-tubulin suppressor-like RCC1 family protein
MHQKNMNWACAMSGVFFALLLGSIAGAQAATPMLSAGYGSSAVLLGDGEILTWGQSTQWDTTSPLRNPSFSGATAIALDGVLAILRSDGTVWTAGANDHGQLGIGTFGGFSNDPVQVPGLTDIVSISVHQNAVFAIHRDGTVSAWGNNPEGRLGNGSTADNPTPAVIQGLSNVVTIAASGSPLALLANGTVYAWGPNGNGQLGDGTTTDRLVPGIVPGLNNVIAVASTGGESVALKSDGTLWNWGFDAGQLGRNATGGQSTPGQLPGVAGVVSIAANGQHAFFITSDGSLWGYGDNQSGDLGIGDPTVSQVYTPTRIALPGQATQIMAANEHTLAVTANGAVYAWGSNNTGQLGDGTLIDRASPVAVLGPGAAGTLNMNLASAANANLPPIASASVSPLSGVAPLQITLDASYSSDSDGSIVSYAWSASTGETASGRVAQMTLSTPGAVVITLVVTDNQGASGVNFSYVTLTSNATVKVTPQLVAGNSYSLALRGDGTIYGWGDTYLTGITGIDLTYFTTAGTSALSGIVSIAGGNGHSLALTQDGLVWGWGSYYTGERLVGNTTPNGISLAQGISGIVAIAAGNAHSLFLKNDGTLWASGANESGEVGDGTNTNRLTAVQVVGLPKIVAIAAGSADSFAIDASGNIWAWGANNSGELGDGTTTNRSVPVKLGVISNVTKISPSGASDGHTLALDGDGNVWAWGYNANGQIGDGTTVNALTPTQVKSISGAVDIAAGWYHSLALLNDGTILSWGANCYSYGGTCSGAGQLGDGTISDHALPAPVHGIDHVSGISASLSSSMAYRFDGTVWMWGANVYGQLGDGTIANRLLPEIVLGVNGAGYLDLLPGVAQQIPASAIPKFIVLATATGSDSSLTVNANVQYDTENAGKSGAVFVTAMVPAGSPLAGGSALAARAGARQRQAAAGTTYVQVQLTPAGWQPVVNGQLTPYVTGVLSSALASQTILNNTNTTAIPGAEFCLGYGTDANAMVLGGTIRSVVSITGAPAGTVISCLPTVGPQSGYWWNPAEGGRGYTIEQNGSSGNVFFAMYLYTASGNPVWYAAGPAVMSGSTFSAPLEAFAGGQTLTGSYHPPAQGASPGNVSITFTDASDATLTLPGETIPIMRYAIVPGGLTATPPATQPQAGYWWNPAEGGRGYTIEVQNNTAFIAAYMYDTSGNPVWYAAGPATLTGSNSYVGNWTTYTGGQSLGGTYRAPSGTANAGSLTIQFSSPTAGTLTLPDGRQIPIQRYSF